MASASTIPREVTRRTASDRIRSRVQRVPLLLYGLLCALLGLAMYMVGVALVIPRYLLQLDGVLLPANTMIVWYSGLPITVGAVLAAADLAFMLPGKRKAGLRYDPVPDGKVTVALTAYNDEESIGPAVRDFLAHPRVGTVVVVSNDSTDATLEAAREAGALAVNERRRGYGHCVHRCLSEALALAESELIVLCEGDRTFHAHDLDKLLAYVPHADVVNGTRTVDRLRQRDTQLSTFMCYGNQFVAKLLEAKHLGRATISDMGTTYKLARRDALARLLPLLDPRINLEFNAYLLDEALRIGLTVVECPITFHPRVGISKGGNSSNWRALKVGWRMMSGIVFGWGRQGACP